MRPLINTTVLVLVTSLAGVFQNAGAAQDGTGETSRGPAGRPMRLVVPFTPGGGSDTVARAIGNKLSDVLRRQVVVDNRPGGGITIGSDLVAKSAPDGNTVLIVTIAHAVNPSLHKTLPYDTEKDFSPISLVTAAPLILVVHPSVPAKSVRELIAIAKSRPGQLDYASPGNGSPTHLAAEMFKSMAGVSVTHIPYKGAAPAMTDLLGGQVQLTFSSPGVAPPFVKAGKLRALAVTTAQRSRFFPELPTIAEAGLPGYELVSWQGILAPGKTPREIVSQLNAAIVTVLNMPDLKEYLAGRGYDATGSTAERFASFISSEIQRWGKLVKSIGARVD